MGRIKIICNFDDVYQYTSHFILISSLKGLLIHVCKHKPICRFRVSDTQVTVKVHGPRYILYLDYSVMHHSAKDQIII